jgi:mono/diheme cytochrome c family protein
MSEKRSDTPVEMRSYGTYYLVFSALLILGTLWAVVDEVKIRRPWKTYQEEYYALAAAKLDSLKAASLAGIDSVEAATLKQTLDSTQVALQSKEYLNAVDQDEKLLKELDAATTDWRFSRSRSDAAYYQFQRKKLDEGIEDPALRKVIDDDDAEIAKNFAAMGVINEKIATLNRTINKYKDANVKALKEYQALYADANKYGDKAEKMEGAPLQIRQVVLNDFEYTPFQEIKARVDRCQTCHLGWNDATMTDAPEPFRQHPLPELLKLHNPETFGCTPCHRGQGPALTAGYAHGDKDEFWHTPILRGNDIYATCNSCHSTETILQYAKPFTRAKQIVAESGCFGCHEINGFSDLAKIGPALNSLPAKVKPEWIFHWVKNPKDYTPHTRMPNFKLTDEQAEAATAYLANIGKESDFKFVSPRGAYRGGSASEGKKLFETVGCQDCHVAGGFTKVREARGTSYDIAPELSRVGSKDNPDWIYDWIRNPRHFNPQTRMPNLRLSDQEAKNIVAYLTTLKDDRTLNTPPLDIDNPKMIAEGEKVIREYGCFGCHDIKGMEKEGKVSVDLSDFDRKLIEQMDFGDTRELPEDSPVDFKADSDGSTWVKHTWRAWVYGKLHNSRQYQTERIVQKMPVFAFTDEEIGLIRTFLLSMTKDVPSIKYQKVVDTKLQDLEAGRRVIRHYNCMQCHNIEDQGGYILAKYDDPALGPPILPQSQGAKVQEQWLYNFLKGPTPIRPWLKIRMPTFSLTDLEISKITKYFLARANKDLVIRDYSAIPVDQKYLGPGKKLFETYQCGKCHPSGPVTLGGETSASDLAPNLAQAHNRLKPEWIIDWLHDPQKLQPGTRMPAFFYEGMGPDQTIFGGKADEQIKALEAYVWNLGRKNRVLTSSR